MPRFIAIDIDAHGLLVAVGTPTRTGPGVEQVIASLDSPQPLSPSSAKALGAKLREVLKTANIAPAPVLVCFGRDRVILKDVKYPAVPPADEPNVVRYQVQKELSDTTDDVVLDYIPHPHTGDDGERKATVAFLRRDLYAAAKVLCEVAGLKLAAVTPRPYAIAAATTKALADGAVPPPEPSDAPVAVLTLTEVGGEFTVLRTGRVVFSRTIPASAVATEAALVDVVRRNLTVAAGQAGGDDVQAVYIAEGDAARNGWSGRLRSALPVPVFAFDPLAGVTAAEPMPAELHGRLVGPVGLLAARGAVGALPINFHQTRQPRAAASASRSRLLAGALVGLLFLGLLAVGAYLLVSRAETRLANLIRENTDADETLKTFERDAARLSAVEEFTGREVVWLDELYDLADRFPDIKKVKLMHFDGALLPMPTDRERTAQKLLPPKGNEAKIGKLNLTVVADGGDLPQKIVQAMAQEGRFYPGVGKSNNGFSGGKTGLQQFLIATQLTHRSPADYKRKLSAAAPVIVEPEPPAPVIAPEAAAANPAPDAAPAGGPDRE